MVASRPIVLTRAVAAPAPMGNYGRGRVTLQCRRDRRLFERRVAPKLHHFGARPPESNHPDGRHLRLISASRRSV